MTVMEEYAVEIVKLIFSMTLTGSILSIFLFLLKPVIKDKLPKSFQYYMWFSVVIALMLPVSKIIVIPIANDSLMPMKTVYDIAQWVSDTVSAQHSSQDNLRSRFSCSIGNFDKCGRTEGSSQDNLRSRFSCFPSAAVILFVFWQLGMILVLGVHILCYVCYVRKLGKHNRSANEREIKLLNNLLEGKKTLRLYKNAMVETPILVGFFHPAVLLPDKTYEDINLRNILLHEVIHMKRHDIFVKWLFVFVVSIHWFNPLVYRVRREMNQACELACDESAIKRFDVSEMQQYGDTLIAVASDSIRKTPFPITMFEDKKNLKERLDAIMKHQRYSKKTVIAAGVMLVTIASAVLGLNTLHEVESEHHYADNFPLPQDQKRIKEIELKKVLRSYDEENIAEAYVFLGDLDGEITEAYINIVIVSQEKNLTSDMQSELKSLAAEELGLDIQNVYIEYIDFDSYTSNERAGK